MSGQDQRDVVCSQKPRTKEIAQVMFLFSLQYAIHGATFGTTNQGFKKLGNYKYCQFCLCLVFIQSNCYKLVQTSGFTGLFNTKDHGTITLVI